jgi:hypothetical protein
VVIVLISINKYTSSFHNNITGTALWRPASLFKIEPFAKIERKDYLRYDGHSVSLEQRRTDPLMSFVSGRMKQIEENK